MRVWSLGWEDPWRREWLLTPVFLSGEFHGQRNLAAYSSQGRRESDTTEQLCMCASYKKENKKQTPGHIVWAKSYYEYISLSLFMIFAATYILLSNFIPYIDCFTCHLTCILRNLYGGQEATVRMGYGTTDWFQIGIGGHQGCLLSPCLFNLYAEYIM